MKKFIILLVLAFFAVTSVAAANESPYYAKSVFITKIVSHQKGYKITYLDNKHDPIVVYVPMDWFYKQGNGVTDDGFVKAEMIYGIGPQFPYMTIFWKNGKFHHLRIFANSDYNDPSWGVLEPTDNVEGHVDGTKDIPFVFMR